jgi:hypothetical protein
VTEAVARGARAPWTERLSDALPLAPIWLGAGIALGLGTLFVALELALGRHELLAALPEEERSLRDVRIAFVQFLLLGYAPSAYLYVVRGARRRVETLRPLLGPADAQVRSLADRTGVYTAGSLRAAGFVGAAGGLLMPLLAEGAEFAYRPSFWSPEVTWHRILSPLIGWWMGRFVFAVLSESRRLSSLAASLRPVDLFDLSPLAPFTRQGVANAALNVGFVAIFALTLVESGFGIAFAVLGTLGLGVGAVGLLLPVHGVRLRIRAARRAELDWCGRELRRARAALASGAGAPSPRLSDLLAYRSFLDGVREWPFDASTLLRVGLYLLIPLGSWAGGALVERAIDALLG